MPDDTPFNPVPLPEGLLLSREPTSTAPPPSTPGTGQTKHASGRKRRGKRTNQPGREATDALPQTRWQRIKARFNARLCQIDPETLKRILTAAGVAAGIVIAILIAIKLTGIALVLLGILGSSLCAAPWDRLRLQPPPF